MPSGKEVKAIPRTRKAVAQQTADQVHDLLKIVETSLDDDKAEDIVAIDLRGKSTIADYMVIATGRNSRQLAAMASHLDEKLTKAGVRRVSVEGADQGDWVLLDGGDVVVHLFRPEVRTFYALEKMWGAEMPSPERLTAVG
ncbi:ribosome silencing factor [Dongia deserti]|uniref:ribosome silencing factor n=1 Tax=Dongia deserti TaxID=2268030 RepID=UPI000E656FCF|nr:ribosome silencing factor [Dongia deserti]